MNGTLKWTKFNHWNINQSEHSRFSCPFLVVKTLTSDTLFCAVLYDLLQIVSSWSQQKDLEEQVSLLHFTLPFLQHLRFQNQAFLTCKPQSQSQGPRVLSLWVERSHNRAFLPQNPHLATNQDQLRFFLPLPHLHIHH